MIYGVQYFATFFFKLNLKRVQQQCGRFSYEVPLLKTGGILGVSLPLDGRVPFGERRHEIACVSIDLPSAWQISH